ncbi:hypothetical protein BH23ACT7_BH23ACT7_04690 [soil metagenome]
MATVTHRVVGATTPSAAKVTARVSGAGSARLKVSTSSDLRTDPAYSPAVAADANGMVTLEVTGLAADARYHFGLELDGVLDTAKQGQFRTHPPAGVATSFQFAFGNCSNGDNAVYDFLLARDPLFWIHNGDLHYGNVNSTDQQLYRDAYNSKLVASKLHNAVARCALVHVWDDHDFCGDNSDGSSVGRTAVQNVWRQYFPERGLPVSNGDGIYRTFDVGRVRFLVLDLRSHRTPSAAPDDASKTMLGATQKQWFKDTLTASAANPVVFVVSSGPWNSTDASGDSWSRYGTERQELTDFIQTNVSSGVYFLCGDMHGIAYDDGTNSPGGFPVAHAGAFASSSSVKGGPYSSGDPITGNKKYGLMDITDNGAEIVTTFYAWDTSSGSEMLARAGRTPTSSRALRLPARRRGRTESWRQGHGLTSPAGSATCPRPSTSRWQATPSTSQSSVGPTSDVIELSLSDLVDPGSSAGHLLRYRIRSENGRLAVSWAELETPAEP